MRRTEDAVACRPFPRGRRRESDAVAMARPSGRAGSAPRQDSALLPWPDRPQAGPPRGHLCCAHAGRFSPAPDPLFPQNRSRAERGGLGGAPGRDPDPWHWACLSLLPEGGNSTGVRARGSESRGGLKTCYWKPTPLRSSEEQLRECRRAEGKVTVRQ